MSKPLKELITLQLELSIGLNFINRNLYEAIFDSII